MKIVHIEDFVHPSAGYQINMLTKAQVKLGHDVTIVTSELNKIPDNLKNFFGAEDIEKKDKHFTETTGVKIIRVPLISYISGRAIFYPKVLKTIKSSRPDIVFVHGCDTFTGITLTLFSSLLKVPIILDNHMLEMASTNKFKGIFRCFYKTFVAPVIIKKKIPLIRVADSDFVEKFLGVPLSKTKIFSFGTETDYFKPDDKLKKELRGKYDIDEEAFVVIYAGKLDVHKGGQLLADSLKKKINLSNKRQLVFIVIGNTVGEYGDKVEQTILESENKIIRFPTQLYYELGNFYKMSDLAIFPKQCSMTFFEAQSCGLPVIFEANEINNSRIVNGNAYIFQPNNIEDFREKIIKIAELNSEMFNKARESARQFVMEKYDFGPIARQYTSLMEIEVKRFNK